MDNRNPCPQAQTTMLSIITPDREKKQTFPDTSHRCKEAGDLSPRHIHNRKGIHSPSASITARVSSSVLPLKIYSFPR